MMDNDAPEDSIRGRQCGEPQVSTQGSNCERQCVEPQRRKQGEGSQVSKNNPSGTTAQEFDRNGGGRLHVRPSCIQGAGDGLFSLVSIQKGEVVCCYQSEVILPTREAVRLPDKSYLMRLGPQTYIDLRHEFHVVARFINDCRVPGRYNVAFEKRPEEGRALAVALRDIEAGEELYADYGRWYWLGCGIRPSRLQTQ
mmetsp:Transcript_46018/g.92022  ORF Transcript_46018/g.92022 Transcript_46018/m.92022 type:complete len:197 (+) Transcript_46018:25-615(+)